MRTKILICTSIITSLLGGCASYSTKPRYPENVCEIFKENRSWYKAAANTKKKWGAPEHVTMAMMYQESSFRHDAAPPMQYFLFIPTGRPSTAYGYAQAKDEVWDDYIRATGNSWASRTNFFDAMDFMGWYMSKNTTVNGTSKWDARAQYLAYHEGWGGYRRQTYREKPWLQRVAVIVDQRAKRYANQLRTCRKDLESSWFWRKLGMS